MISKNVKSIVSIYNPIKFGTLKRYQYDAKKGCPRPGWTYRARRRNVALRRETEILDEERINATANP